MRPLYLRAIPVSIMLFLCAIPVCLMFYMICLLSKKARRDLWEMFGGEE